MLKLHLQTITSFFNIFNLIFYSRYLNLKKVHSWLYAVNGPLKNNTFQHKTSNNLASIPPYCPWLVWLYTLKKKYTNSKTTHCISKMAEAFENVEQVHFSCRQWTDILSVLYLYIHRRLFSWTRATFLLIKVFGINICCQVAQIILLSYFRVIKQTE